MNSILYPSLVMQYRAGFFGIAENSKITKFPEYLLINTHSVSFSLQ